MSAKKPTPLEALKAFASIAFVIAVVWWVQAGRDEEPLPFALDHSGYSDDDVETVKRAYEIMLANCRPLGREGNVTAIRAELGPPWNPDRTAEWGWTREVRFMVDVPGWPHTDMGRAAGHTLYIALGGGGRPGIATQKDETRPICGTGGTPPGHDAFRDVAGLAFIR